MSGETPVARTLAWLASRVGYEVTALAPDASPDDLPGVSHLVRQPEDLRTALGPRTYLVVASAGEYDEPALEQAASADLAYLALVASPSRAAALRGYLVERGLPEPAVAKITAPAGLDLGAVEPEEIAVSILAEMIQVRRRASGETPSPGAATQDGPGEAESPVAAVPTHAVDPIRGMSVEIATARYVTDAGGEKVYFCCPACQRRFEREAVRPEGGR